MSQNSFIVYGKQGCSNCETVKQMLGFKQIKFVYKSVPEDLSAKDFSIVMEAFGVFPRSFPQIVMIGEDNLAFYVGAGQKGLIELAKMLK